MDIVCGQTYSADGKVPLMPKFDPADPIKAIGQMRVLEPGTAFKVKSLRMGVTAPWYRVDCDGQEGWINSIAIIGKTVRRHSGQ